MFDELRKRVNKEIEAFFDEEISRASDVGKFNKKFYETLKEFVLRGGKRLRPILSILVYRALGKEDDKVVRPAISIELLHNSTLIHDDIIDRDELRRGKPTFHVIWREEFGDEHVGMSFGILGGDLVRALGLKTIFSSDLDVDLKASLSEIYDRAYITVVDGVLKELDMVFNPHVTEDDYMDMIYRKTAALFEASAAIGAKVARADEFEESKYREFAKLVGMAFQIQDDILGSFGDPKVIGKPVDSDIREKKRTILLIKALEDAEPDDLKVLYEYLKAKDVTKDMVEKVREILKKYGLPYARQKALELVERAKELVADAPNYEDLRAYAEFVVFRRKRVFVYILKVLRMCKQWRNSRGRRLRYLNI